VSNVKLSASETADVEKVLKSRSQKGSKEQKPKQSQRNKTSKPDEVVEAQAEATRAYKAMKKLLKPRTKTELIELLWTYGIQLQQMQHACQVLIEENKELKGE